MKIEKKLDKLHADYMIGTTVFKEKNKKYLLCSYYDLSIENGNSNKKKLPIFYGSSMHDVLDKAIKHFKAIKKK